jgi:hypothetical protein
MHIAVQAPGHYAARPLERRRRQDEITTELLDIVTGAEAVVG